MASQRRRVHVKFFYDTTADKVDNYRGLGYGVTYAESISRSLMDAIAQHAGESFAERIKKVEVRISKPHKECHCPTEKCKCRKRS